MTSGDWIAVVGIAITVATGGIGWLTYIAVNVGRIVQKIDGFNADLMEVRQDVQKHDTRIDKLERRSAAAH